MKWYLLLLPVFLCNLITAQEPDSSSAIFSMREAERSFSKASAAHGRKVAFSEFLAEESVIFTDKWITSGRDFWRNRQPTPSILKWEPEYMNISIGRNFGLSTGPWEAQEYRPNTEPLGTGYFVSIWEKQKDDEWKVIFDAGAGTPPPKKPHSFSFPSDDDNDAHHLTITSSNTSSSLKIAETLFFETWEKNRPGCLKMLGANCRMLMPGNLPFENLDTISSRITRFEKDLTWESSGSRIAPAGDQGFTYGYMDSPGRKPGHYMMFWEKDRAGEWKVLLWLIN